MPTAEFYAFILSMLAQSLPSIPSQDFKRVKIEDLPKLFDDLFDKVKKCPARNIIEIGQMTLAFFRNASALSGSRMLYTWPKEVTGNRSISFEESTLKFLAGECEKALVKLSYHRSAKTLLFQVKAIQ